VIRRFPPLLAILVGAACTEVSTDPNAVVAVRFDGSPYPSIVALDSLRDSLGKLQPLIATGLNYKGDAVVGAKFAFSSSDTNVRVFDDGNVYAIRRKTDGIPAKVYATAAALQSVPDSLFIVQRADSIKAMKQVDTALFTPGVGAATATGSPTFQVFGDTAAGKPKAPVPGWLLSLQLRYKGTTIAPADTGFAFTFEVAGGGTNAIRVQRIVDTTDASGTAGHRVFVRNLSAAEDSIYLIATIRQRKANTLPIRDSTLIIIRQAPPTSSSLRRK
jgi:hypothetical protein